MSLKIVKRWSDFEQLNEIEAGTAATYEKAGYASSPWTTGWPEDFGRYQANDLLWVALADGKPAGFAVCDIFKDMIHLEEIDVHPAYQGKGIGKALLTKVIEEAIRRRLTAITLRTFATTPWSINLYRKFGFQEINQGEEPYYISTHRAAERSMGFPEEGRCTMILPLPSPTSVNSDTFLPNHLVHDDGPRTRHVEG